MRGTVSCRSLAPTSPASTHSSRFAGACEMKSRTLMAGLWVTLSDITTDLRIQPGAPGKSKSLQLPDARHRKRRWSLARLVFHGARSYKVKLYLHFVADPVRHGIVLPVDAV